MKASAELAQHRFTAFGGSQCHIVCVDGDAADIAVLTAEVYAFEAALTRFSPQSELSHFNASVGRRCEVSPLLNELLRVALRAWASSDGMVNAAVHDAVVGAGYDASIEIVRGRDAVQPTADAVTIPALSEVLRVGDGWASLEAGHRIDLGGVGKGWLADALCERFDNAMVNLGGDLRVRGPGPDGDGWPVGMSDGKVVVVRDAGVATSGTNGRAWRGGHHLIDPRSGRPAVTDIAAVSVVAASALDAEVLAKAAVILGRETAPSWLADHGALRWQMDPEDFQ